MNDSAQSAQLLAALAELHRQVIPAGIEAAVPYFCAVARAIQSGQPGKNARITALRRLYNYLMYYFKAYRDTPSGIEIHASQFIALVQLVFDDCTARVIPPIESSMYAAFKYYRYMPNFDFRQREQQQMRYLREQEHKARRMLSARVKRFKALDWSEMQEANEKNKNDTKIINDSNGGNENALYMYALDDSSTAR